MITENNRGEPSPAHCNHMELGMHGTARLREPTIRVQSRWGSPEVCYYRARTSSRSIVD